MGRPTPTWAEQALMAYDLFLVLMITVSNGRAVSAQYSAHRTAQNRLCLTKQLSCSMNLNVKNVAITEMF